MLKKTITYKTFIGEKVTEDFYFNFTKAELADRQLSTKGGLSNFLQKVLDAKDDVALYALFKDLILDAYGVLSEDGKKFLKSKQISEDFSHSEPYSIIFMDIVNDAESAIAFFKGILPADLSAEITPDQIKTMSEKYS